MTVYLASFLGFLALAVALAACKARGDHSGGRCGGCPAGESADCVSHAGGSEAVR